MPSLTRTESRRRAELLSVTSYDVSLDLQRDDETFHSVTTVRFSVTGDGSSAGGETFVDVKPVRLLSAHLDGTPLDVDSLQDGRLPLRGLSGEHELVVAAVMGYRNDGEGLHRAVDPADGLHYTYAMSFLDAAPSIFACFDQPDLKAPYTFHVRAPRDWIVVGNARAEQVEPGTWELATTPPLSTYFVTLVAGPYHVLRDEHDGIALGLSARRSLARHLDTDAEEILTVTRQCFDEFHRLFGSRYAFGDYHQAFVPEFNAGAMENPGCVTFRDPLVFTSQVTRSARIGRASTIAHEMAHQWFGDLVTMRWWDDLWLNESFAEYMGNRVTAEATEFDDAWVQSAFARTWWGLTADQRPTTHPVAGNGAQDALSALQDFDGISYVKGSSVLRQLSARLGEDVFLAGVRAHFEQNRFGNATMHDLFAAWESAGAGDLGGWIDGWLRTPGLDRFEVVRGDAAGGELRVRRTPPAGHPADREHTLGVAWLSQDGSCTTEEVTVREDETVVGSVPPDRPVVLDPHGQTWAGLSLDATTLAALPELLPRITDPLTRAGVWNAIRDGLYNAEIHPEAALELAEAALVTEDQDAGLGSIAVFAADTHDSVRRRPATSAARFLPAGSGAVARTHAAVTRRLATAESGSGLQTAAMNAAVGTCTDPDRLRSWLSGELPDGVEPDSELRWRVLIRLAVLGATDREELRDDLARDPSAQARVDLAHALASLPDAEAKQWAWDRFTGRVDVPNYELYAAGAGLWQPGQEELTAPYVERFFTELPATVDVRTGWVLAETVRYFYPQLAVEEATFEASQRLLAGDALEPSLRRQVADATEDLRRGLVVRESFGC